MTIKNYSKELEVSKNLAIRAGEVMLEYFNKVQEATTKSDNSLVTVVDKTINRMVIEDILAEFPGDDVVGEEESTLSQNSVRKWFCDPVDGTNAYICGVPTAMFSLAFLVNGEPVVGVMYDPFLKRMFFGTKGEGSFCNSEKLQVSEQSLQGSFVVSTSNVKRIIELEYLRSLLKLGVRLSSVEGAVCKSSLVARGKVVAYIGENTKAHDIAAAHLIVEEAGGRATDLSGNKLDYINGFQGALLSNGKVHQELLAIIKGGR